MKIIPMRLIAMGVLSVTLLVSGCESQPAQPPVAAVPPPDTAAQAAGANPAAPSTAPTPSPAPSQEPAATPTPVPAGANPSAPSTAPATSPSPTPAAGSSSAQQMPPKSANAPKPAQAKPTAKQPAAAAPSKKPQPLQPQRIYSLDGISGWGSENGTMLQTGDTGATWSAFAPGDIRKSDVLVGSHFQNSLQGYIFYLRASGPKPQLLVSQSATDGSSIIRWDSASLPTSEEWETSADVKPIVSGEYDARYVLLTSGPALGQMSKSLYAKDNEGVSWKAVSKLDGVKGYPTSITFRKPKEGWITAMGRDEGVPLYRTQDGGATWSLQPVAIPKDLAGSSVNTYQLAFDSESDNRAVFIAEFTSSSGHTYVTYESRDSGATWNPLPYRLKDVQAPPVLHFDDLLEGRALSSDGSTLYTMDTYSKEDWQKINLPVPLGQADQLYLRHREFGWVLRQGAVLVTKDGGNTWAQP